MTASPPERSLLRPHQTDAAGVCVCQRSAARLGPAQSGGTSSSPPAQPICTSVAAAFVCPRLACQLEPARWPARPRRGVMSL